MTHPIFDPYVIPSSAVTVAGSRFTPGPHKYVVLPLYGDGHTPHRSREEAMAAAREPQEHRA